MATILDIPQEVSAAPAPAQAQGTAVGGGGGAGAAAAAQGTPSCLDAAVGEPGGGSTGAPAAAQGTDLTATVGGGSGAGALAAAAQAPAGVTEEDDGLGAEQKWIEDNRASLRLWTILAAAAAYASGLNPPMGRYRNDAVPPHRYEAGDPVMVWKAPRSYAIFKLSTDISFGLSFLIMFMLSHQSFYRTKERMRALKTVCIVHMLAFGCFFLIGSDSRFPLSHTLGNLLLAFGFCVLVYLAFLTVEAIYKKWLLKKKKAKGAE